MFPNPTNSLLNVEFKIVNGTKAKISIENILGQIVYSQETTNETNKMDVSTITNGVYFLKVVTSEGQTVQRIVISK